MPSLAERQRRALASKCKRQCACLDRLLNNAWTARGKNDMLRDKGKRLISEISGAYEKIVSSKGTQVGSLLS